MRQRQTETMRQRQTDRDRDRQRQTETDRGREEEDEAALVLLLPTKVTIQEKTTLARTDDVPRTIQDRTLVKNSILYSRIQTHRNQYIDVEE